MCLSIQFMPWAAQTDRFHFNLFNWLIRFGFGWHLLFKGYLLKRNNDDWQKIKWLDISYDKWGFDSEDQPKRVAGMPATTILPAFLQKPPTEKPTSDITNDFIFLVNVMTYHKFVVARAVESKNYDISHFSSKNAFTASTPGSCALHDSQPILNDQ